MPETLIISLPEDLADDASWVVLDDAGTCIGRQQDGSLETAARFQEQRLVTVLVPATQVSFCRAELPVRSHTKMLQVVPFALEEQLAGDVTRMHFALGQRNANGSVSVLAVPIERMDAWVAALDEAGITAQRILPDLAGLMAVDGSIEGLIQGHEAALRTPDEQLLFVDTSVLGDWLAGLRDSHTNEDGVAPSLRLLVGDDADEHAPALANLADRFPDIEFRRPTQGILPRLARNALNSNAPSLLQGEYAPSGALRKALAPWKFAAGMLLGLFAVLLAAQGVELLKLRSEYQALQTNMNAVLARSVPNTPPGDDPRAVFERILRGGDGADTSGAPFLEALDAVASAWPRGVAASLQNVSFRSGILTLSVIAPDVATLDALAAGAAGSSGWLASLESTRPVSDGVGVEGKLRMERGR